MAVDFRDMRAISPELRGYIAGLVDGEGSIGIYKQLPSGHRKSADYRLRVSITNTNGDVLRWVKSICGGFVAAPYQRPRRKPVYHWVLKGDDAAQFIRIIYDLIRIKKSQAWLALEFLEQCAPYSSLMKRGKGNGSGGGERSLEGTAMREGFWLAMHHLNQKGELE